MNQKKIHYQKIYNDHQPTFFTFAYSGEEMEERTNPDRHMLGLRFWSWNFAAQTFRIEIQNNVLWKCKIIIYFYLPQQWCNFATCCNLLHDLRNDTDLWRSDETTTMMCQSFHGHKTQVWHRPGLKLIAEYTVNHTDHWKGGIKGNNWVTLKMVRINNWNISCFFISFSHLCSKQSELLCDALKRQCKISISWM